MTRTFQVSLEQQVFSVEAEQPILNAALEQGIAWPHRCRQGVCCRCLARRISGELVYHGMAPMLSNAEQQQGWFLACLASAESDLTISLEG
ncbi:2Fe-2S iron-sulfur cluster-binding protein [Agarivorans gilvus]|uniref:Ferredoxin n=1 Tax=Agarivorans gilvus TaxID=680279 RepID=A0ABQ1I0B5_9ALTE|nr:2Fe-2S iron-sulfur cluster-binding protein [Agarivorans gilvus]GGB04220.1 ferredoxin [Agarivorans gilvus]